jgi:phospholipase C
MFNFMPPEFWHNDMHPSEWVKSWSWVFLAQGGPGSVLLGDHLIWQVYEAIRTSQHRDAQGRLLRDRTLLVITFDEHGGCFDHVPPPCATPPTDIPHPEYGFEFRRLGPRVPTVMISSHIAPNTIVNETMHHCSFLKTMQEKWGLGTLGPRQYEAPSFANTVFSGTHRSWPKLESLYRDHPAIARAKANPPKLRRDQPLSRLQSSLLAATYVHLCNLGHGSLEESPKLETQGDAQDFFERFAEQLKQIGPGY